MKNLLKMSDLTPGELTHILDVADQLKAQQKLGGTAPLLAGKTVAMLFSKASTRTRTSFEVGVYQLGGLGNYMNTSELQAGRGEPLKDTARVLGRYYDAIVYRTFKQSDVDALARYSGVPVVSGMTDYAHPLQVLTDLMTVREHKGILEGLKMAYIGDGNNMANSLIVGGLKTGMRVAAACPDGYRPAKEVLDFAADFGDAFTLTGDCLEAAAGADVIFTDVWASMGQEGEAEKRRAAFKGYQVNGALLAAANPGCMVQHCLPAHRGEEITAEVFEAHAQEIFDEAENRLHAQKAVMVTLMK